MDFYPFFPQFQTRSAFIKFSTGTLHPAALNYTEMTSFQSNQNDQHHFENNCFAPTTILSVTTANRY